MSFIADLHVHSRYSRATSRDLDLEHLSRWAQLKGITVVGTGDFTHPGWFAELQEKLVPAEDGLFRLRDELEAAVAREVPDACRLPVRFLLQVEISNIYKKGERVRKVHNLVYVPDLEAAARFRDALARIGNLESDGRPILGLDSRDLLEITLDCSEHAYLIPAHIWTPWFSTLGSKSGFDSVDECFGDLAEHIFAVETGLSSDPPMNWGLSALDRYTLVSNSDAHSPGKLGREAVVFDAELSYGAIQHALRGGEAAGYRGTVEFFPEEGKYHYDGHRACGARLSPAEARQLDGRCPTCGKPVTRGVLARVEELADRALGQPHPVAAAFRSMVPLPEVLAEIHDVGARTRTVERAYDSLVSRLGPELDVLDVVPLEDLERAAGPLLAEAVRRVRAGEVRIAAGYDGEYGTIRLFDPEERTRVGAQVGLFAAAEAEPDARPTSGKRPYRATRRSGASGGEPVTDGPHRNRTLRSDAVTLTDAGGGGVEQAGDVSHPRTTRTPRNSEGATTNEAQTGRGRMGPGEASDATASRYPLDVDQRRAVEAGDEPLLIFAGPGTGKTRVLTYRIAHLVRQRQVPPEQILAVTFTQRAAREMGERLADLLGPETAARLAVRTFHAFGLDVLRADLGRLGRTTDFDVLDDAASHVLLSNAVGVRGAEARRLCDAIARLKGRPLAPEDVAEPELAAAYTTYQAALEAAGAVDYDDLIRLAVRLLREAHDVLDRWRIRCRALFVDEYQDVSGAQYQLLRILAPTGRCLTAVGDPDQAIYGFRGADPTYVRRFEHDYPGAAVIRLRNNYRSTQTILHAARQVVTGGTDDADDILRARREDRDAVVRITLHEVASEAAEAETIVHLIERLLGGTSLFSLDSGRVDTDEVQACGGFGEIAVLYRTHAQARALEEALGRSGIPYQRVSTPPDEREPFDPRAERVALLTLHAAKGLEFPVVFIVGCEDGLLPYRRPGAAGMEVNEAEERRLLYVGMTRAQRLLFLTRARRRVLYGEAREPGVTPFLGPLDSALLIRERRRPSARRPSQAQLTLFDER